MFFNHPHFSDTLLGLKARREPRPTGFVISYQFMQNGENEPRLPQIDPVTFAALNVIDSFLGRAPLTRQEHVEANKNMQHIVHMIEMLQSMVKGQRMGGHQPGTLPIMSGLPPNGGMEKGQMVTENAEPRENGPKIVAEVAEEIFRKAK